MYVKAFSLGCAIPRTNFDAYVHSVFRSAANLRLAGKDKLLTLVAAGEADLPQGIRVDTPSGFSFDTLQAGEEATCRDDLLRIASASLVIDLHTARRWKCDLPALEADLTNPAAAAAWKWVWRALNRRQRLLGAEIVAEELFRSDGAVQVAGKPRKVRDVMHRLVDATRRYDRAGIVTLRDLIGLGTGLTPSGDDLLVGYLTGLWCAVKHSPERKRFVSSVSRAVIRLSRRTNEISRTYLCLAARGQVSSRLATLAEMICRGENPDHLSHAVEATLRVGHTSGMDAVAGLLAGFAAWTAQPLVLAMAVVGNSTIASSGL